MATINDIIDEVRNLIVDYTILQTNITDESPVSSKPTGAPHVSYNYWNTFSTGRSGEEFLSKKAPMVSGCKVRLKGGRWSYDLAGEFPQNYGGASAHNGKREFLVDYYRSLFLVPSGAVPIASGDRVLLTYSYWEDQDYRFSDTEIKSWLLDGDTYLRDRVILPWEISGRGSSIAFTVTPSGGWLSLLALSTSYLMRQRLQEEAVQDGIFIKTGSTTLDTSKTLAHRGKSLDQVKKDLDGIIDVIKMGDLVSAGARIDLYSTQDLSYGYGFGYYQETNNPSFPPWVG